MTNKARETCVHVGYFIHLGVFMFLQNCLRIRGYSKIFNFGYPVPEITENTHPYLYVGLHVTMRSCYQGGLMFSSVQLHCNFLLKIHRLCFSLF